MDMAQKEHLVPAIDNLLLLRCLQLLRARGDDDTGIPYVLNVSGTTLNDRGFMGDLVNFLSQNRHMAKSLIFELPQDEIDGMDNELVPVLDGLSKLGCRFSMDRVHKRQIDINILKNRHIRFIKMDATWLLREGGTKTGYSRIVRFKKQLDTAGIDLIVEKIEKEQTLRELLDYNIDFGQGYLFGRPDVAAAFDHKKKAA
jgi:cyclic-di-GMP phosphodiesterase TipF (flagellum assembly factor)